jgi:hypothetical protein
LSHDSYVSGYIKLENREGMVEALAQLPTASGADTWPYLTRSMFSITDDPRYREDVLHFGASFKDILSGWGDWERKFEKLLIRLEHRGARVLVEDCYRGDFLVSWIWVPVAGAETRLQKKRRYIDYQEGAEIELP